jgi:1-aminocyclopropane-1-carboxylate deaminase
VEAFRTINSVLQPLVAPCLGRTENIFIKRDDLIHPIVSGNKWRKLKYYLEEGQKNNCNHLVTYGGAYSNHMVAAACAAATLGLKASCFLRGDELTAGSNHFLTLAKWYGMKFIPVERSIYRDQKEGLYETHFGQDAQAFMVPEGGAGDLGELGVADMAGELEMVPDLVFLASATATTVVGLARGFASRTEYANSRIKGIAVLNNVAEQQAKLESIGPNQGEILGDHTHGGYAKTTDALMEFVKIFIRETGILIDPVYTGKALFALKTMLGKGEIPLESKVLFVHTGGTLGLFSDRFMK